MQGPESHVQWPYEVFSVDPKDASTFYKSVLDSAIEGASRAAYV